MDHKVKGTEDAAGIIPVVLLAIGFMPQYVDIIKLRSVVGVSMAFIAADAAGSIFSMISLAFRDTFDILATMNYVVVFVCDMIVVALYYYYNKRHPELSRISHNTNDNNNININSLESVGTMESKNTVVESKDVTNSQHSVASTIVKQEEDNHE